MYSWKCFCSMETMGRDECSVQEESKKVNEKCGWLFPRVFFQNMSDFWDSSGSSRMISGASWMKSGYFQGNFPVKVKTQVWSFLLYGFSRQKVGWQFTACCSLISKIGGQRQSMILGMLIEDWMKNWILHCLLFWKRSYYVYVRMFLTYRWSKKHLKMRVAIHTCWVEKKSDFLDFLGSFRRILEAF